MERSGLGDHVRDTLRTQELTRTIKNLQEELAQARRAEALASEAMSVARIEAASATEGEAAASAEASRLRGALGQEQEALGRVKGLLAAAEAERDQLKVALEGTKVGNGWTMLFFGHDACTLSECDVCQQTLGIESLRSFF